MVWSPNLAYVIGLIATDGNLSKDGRHIDITSKDFDLLLSVEGILQTNNKFGIKSSPSHAGRLYHRLQFSNVQLYRFLLTLGLHPNKSKTLGAVAVPETYFADFLRGCWDGDGFTYSYRDKRWPTSFLFYSGLVSASSEFLLWIQSEILRQYGLLGRIKSCGRSAQQLVFAKQNSILLMKKLYYCDTITCLERKRCKVQEILDIINTQAQVAKLVYA